MASAMFDRGALDLEERFWSGSVDHEDNPLFHTEPTALCPIALVGDAGGGQASDGVYMILGFCNVAVIRCSGEIVLVDIGAASYGEQVADLVRKAFPADKIVGVVYTHGHVDHIGGVASFLSRLQADGQHDVRLYGHRLVGERIRRYAMTSGYNASINARQFQAPVEVFVPLFEGLIPPNVVVGDSGARISLGGGRMTVELAHARGETDDALWGWVPEVQTLLTGDLFINCCPNCGNPQKSQRYPLEWAAALKHMEAKGARGLVPGHGPPITKSSRIVEALTVASAFLESVCSQTLRLINQNVSLHEILSRVTFDEGALKRPFMKPYYDDPTFIVRNLYRQYAGWYSGFLPDLRLANPGDVGRILGNLAPLDLTLRRLGECVADATSKPAGTAEKRAALTAALTVAEYLVLHLPKDSRVIELRNSIVAALLAEEKSLMGKGIYSAALRQASKL